MTTHSILWRGFHWPGYEACQLFLRDSRWHLAGAAAFSYQQLPCRLDYQISCDSEWQTVAGTVVGWVGLTAVNIDLAVKPDYHWWLNGLEYPAVAGCIDLDLNFSPSTNLLPIRRLGLAIGQAAQINAAWLRFPSFELELLPQVYRRLDQTIYRYESAGSQFVADLQVDPVGFVMNYPGLWQADAVI